MLAGVTKIIYRRGSAKPIKNKFYNRFFLNKGITNFIANSISTKEKSLELISNFADDKINLIYNGVDLNKFNNPELKTNLRKEFNISNDKKILVNVGRLDEQKGQEYLIKAANILKNRFDKFVILLVGDGIMEEKLNSKVKEFNLENEVIFTGFREDISSILNQSDFMVHTALWEGCPWSVLEALAAGLPVVATDSTSLPEIIIDGKNGYLARNKDIYDLADKMYEMLINADLSSMSVLARKTAEEKYSFTRVIDQVEECILE
jgi:glycosyltransferase involved in cell wall biosynthesis